jgi:membrane-associated phospholipid phosphatase
MQPPHRLNRTPLIAGSILCTLYVLLAIVVNTRALASPDLDITLCLQNVLPRSLDLPASIPSLLGSAEVTIPIFVILVILSKPAHRTRLVALFLLATLLEVLGKTMIDQPGPPILLHRYVFDITTPTGEFDTPYSFPSGHSLRAAFLIVLGIALIAQSTRRAAAKITATALLLAAGAAMLVSRVYIGDHWTSDVVGGALLGAGLCLFAFLTD